MNRDPKRRAKPKHGATPPRAAAPARRVSWWLPIVIALVTAYAFLPAIQDGFTDWDDPFYVTEQPLIRDLSPAGIRAMFTRVVEGNYHPLTMVSLAADYHFWKLNPRGYHVVNVVLHVLVTLAVFWLVYLLTASNGMAAVVALFFGIHPLHVESVAWVSGRKDVLYALFYVGACITHVLWVRARRRRAPYYAATITLFGLSLLSKGMAVSLPLALLAIDFYLQRKASVKALLLEKAPFFLIALILGYVAVVAQAKQGAVQTLASHTLFERILFACYGISAYWIRAIVPGKLSALYPYPLRTAGGGLPLVYYLAPLGVLALAAGAILSLRQGRGIAFGALFFLVNVALVLQLFPVGSAVIADRYTYLSYIGIGFVIAIAYRYLAEGVLARRAVARTGMLVLLAVAGAGAVMATRARCEVWKDNITLWNDVLAQYPNLPIGYTMRARSYMQEGRNDLALSDAQKALSLDPDQPRALTTRGTIRYLNGDNEGALSDLERAVRLEPREPVPWNSLGAVHLSMGKHDLALAAFTQAVALKSDYAEAYLNRALTFCGMSRFEQAMPDFDASIRLRPGNARAHLWRGEARFLLGDKAGAAEDYGRSLDIDPKEKSAWYARSKAYQRLGRYGDALRDALQSRALGYPVPETYIDQLRKAPPP